MNIIEMNPDIPEKMEAGFRRKFEFNGQTYWYDYDLLTFEQVMNAQAIFGHAQEQMQNMPKRFTDWKQSGGVDWLARAFSHLLVREITPGVYDQSYTWKLAEAQEEIIKKFPSKYFKTLATEVQEDFFDKADLFDAASLKRLKPAFEMITQFLSVDPTQIERLKGLGQSQKLNESTTSSDETSQPDDSGSAETPASSGS